MVMLSIQYAIRLIYFCLHVIFESALFCLYLIQIVKFWNNHKLTEKLEIHKNNLKSFPEPLDRKLPIQCSISSKYFSICFP